VPLLVLAMPDRVAAAAFPPAVRTELAALVDLAGPVAPADAPADARALVTGWGTPRLDGGVLARLPDLDAVFHAAGSVRSIVTAPLFERGVRLTKAAFRPIAERLTRSETLPKWSVTIRPKDPGD